MATFCDINLGHLQSVAHVLSTSCSGSIYR